MSCCTKHLQLFTTKCLSVFWYFICLNFVWVFYTTLGFKFPVCSYQLCMPTKIVFGEIVMVMLWEPGLWGNFMVAQHHTEWFFSPLLSIVGVLVWIPSALGTFISVQDFLLLGFNALYHSNGALPVRSIHTVDMSTVVVMGAACWPL